MPEEYKIKISIDAEGVREGLNSIRESVNAIDRQGQQLGNKLKQSLSGASQSTEEFNQDLKQTNSLIGQVEQSIKEWEQAANKATNEKDLQRYNRNIAEARKELTRLKTTGVEGLKQVNREASIGTQIFKGLATTIAAAFSVQAVVNFMKQSYLAYENQKKQERLLLNALKGRADVQKRLLAQASELQQRVAIEDEVIIGIQQYLAAQQLTEEQIKNTTEAAVQLAAVTGDDVRVTAEKLAATFEGNIGRLGRLDRGFTELTLTQLQNGKAVDLVNIKYKTFAEAAVTAADRNKIARKEFAESFGKNITSKIFTPLIEGMTFIISGGLGKALNRASEDLELFANRINAIPIRDFGTEIVNAMSNMPMAITSNNAFAKSAEEVTDTVTKEAEGFKTLDDAIAKLNLQLENEILNNNNNAFATAELIRVKQEQLDEYKKLAEALKDYNSQIEDPAIIQNIINGLLTINEEEENSLNERLRLRTEYTNQIDQLRKDDYERELQLSRDKLDAQAAFQSASLSLLSAFAGENYNIQRTIAIAQHILNIKNAISAVLTGVANTSKGGIFSLPLIAVYLGEMAGIIAQLKSIQFAEGGMLDNGLIKGASHSKGGVPFTIGGVGGFEAEGGEFITNKQSTNKYKPLLEAINNDDLYSINLQLNKEFDKKQNLLENLKVTSNVNLNDDGKLKSIEQLLRENLQNKQVFYYDKYRIEKFGNITRKIRN